MPTGYTAQVATGEIVSFRDFAWICARAFGAMIDLRDDPVGSSQPMPFVPDYYHEKAKADAERKLSKMLKMSGSKRDASRNAAQFDVERRRGEAVAEEARQKARYEGMLACVTAWEPPTPDHVGLKDFMIEQLNESIKFDCYDASKYYTDLPDTDTWYAQEIREMERLIAHHTEEQKKENQRVANRNAWVQSLADSLEGVL